MPDKRSMPASFKEKILNARTIQEAVILSKLDREKHSLSNMEELPLAWSVDKPLCQYCLQELAGENSICALCDEISERAEESRKENTAILVSYEYAQDVANAVEDPFFLLNENQLLVLLPGFRVAEFLFFLKETTTPESHLLNIVFPGRGNMVFGDALAMARYYAENAEHYDDWFTTRFFFNHSHMRSLRFEDFFSFSVIETLFETASTIKSLFPKQDRSVIRELLNKDYVNRIYELNRFYSMCSKDQKTLLDRLKIDESDPERVLTLFQMVRYVSY